MLGRKTRDQGDPYEVWGIRADRVQGPQAHFLCAAGLQDERHAADGHDETAGSGRRRAVPLLLAGFRLAVLALALAGSGCGGEAQPPPAAGPFRVTVDPLQAQGPLIAVVHASNPGRVLWSTVPGQGFAQAAAATATITENRGSFRIEDEILRSCELQTVDQVSGAGDTVTISGRLAGPSCDTGYSLRFFPVSQNQLAFRLDLAGDDPGVNRIFLRYASGPHEGFFGFGEQFTFLDQKGRKFPIVTQEQGIGRGKEPLTSLLNLFSPGSGGSWATTYAAVPQYLTSQGRSLFLENPEVTVFDLEAPEAVEIKLFGASLRGRILYGDNPLDLIREYTSYAGRMPPLPDWLNEGAVVGMQGGTSEVYARLDQLEALGTPIGAFWLQDWVGKRKTPVASQLWWNWVVDPQQYPNWPDLVRTLRDKGIRVTTYINPYLVDIEGQGRPGPNLYRQARDLGYLVRNLQGEPYLIQNTSFDAGIVDLTDPAAREWYKGVIRREMLGTGASGWMADYAEGLPFDCRLFSGEDAAVVHNRFPEEWARLNRELLEEEGLLGEAAFFCRSGYTRSPGQASLFWTGDQLVTFDGDDGMKSAIKGMLSGGFSGMSLNHSDIGGYTTIPVLYPRSRELLLRWMEMAAFTAVYRTHEGSLPEANAQFYSDPGTLAHFARFARVFRALAFYRQELMQEAFARGAPLLRHPLLHYPGDPEVYGLKYQWLLGSEFMVAPVVDEGDRDVNAYLPAGRWVHVWSGREYGSDAQGMWCDDVPAPLGEPAVFYRAGSEAGRRFVENLQDQGLLPNAEDP